MNDRDITVLRNLWIKSYDYFRDDRIKQGPACMLCTGVKYLENILQGFGGPQNMTKFWPPLAFLEEAF